MPASATRPTWTRATGAPDSEIARLAAHSYELVCAGLTRKQKAELAALN